MPRRIPVLASAALLLVLLGLQACTMPQYWIILNRSDTPLELRYRPGIYAPWRSVCLTPGPLIHRVERYRRVDDYEPLVDSKIRNEGEGLVGLEVPAGMALMIGTDVYRSRCSGMEPFALDEAFLEIGRPGDVRTMNGEAVFRAFRVRRGGRFTLVVE